MEVSPGDICYPYSEDTEKIIDCAFRVANYLGNGFLEAVYQKCLEIELAGADIPFESQKELHIFYKGEDIGLTYRADIVVDKKIIIELKAKDKLKSEDEAQLIHYLRATGYKLGLLINFGHKRRMEIRRFINSETVPDIE